MRTAMQQAIDLTKAKIEVLELSAKKEDAERNYMAKNMRLKEAQVLRENVEIMEKLRDTVEKEQIIKARSNGDIYTALALGHTSAAFDWYEKASLDCANKYYEQTYGNG